jgi:hypothetical protein
MARECAAGFHHIHGMGYMHRWLSFIISVSQISLCLFEESLYLL